MHIDKNILLLYDHTICPVIWSTLEREGHISNLFIVFCLLYHLYYYKSEQINNTIDQKEKKNEGLTEHKNLGE